MGPLLRASNKAETCRAIRVHKLKAVKNRIKAALKRRQE